MVRKKSDFPVRLSQLLATCLKRVQSLSHPGKVSFYRPRGSNLRVINRYGGRQ